MRPISVGSVILITLLSAANALAGVIGDLSADDPVVAPLGEPVFGYYGETFIAPTGTLDNASVKLGYDSMETWAGQQNDLDFRILITETSGSGTAIAPTVVVFESQTLTVPLDLSFPVGSLDLDTYTISLGGLVLNPGDTYALILDAFVGFDGIPSFARVGMNNDGYSGGHFFYYVPFPGALNGDRADHFAAVDNWEEFPNQRDMAFNINYTSPGVGVPEPGTLSLFAAGLLVLGFMRRSFIC